MHSFEVHSKESTCRKRGCLGWTKSNSGSTHILAVCFQNFVGHVTSDINGQYKVPLQYYWRIWIGNRLITKHDPLIPKILTDVSDISSMSGNDSFRHFCVKFIVTMGCMVDNQGLQLDTVIPQTLGRYRLDILY